MSSPGPIIVQRPDWDVWVILDPENRVGVHLRALGFVRRRDSRFGDVFRYESFDSECTGAFGSLRDAIEFAEETTRA